MDQKIVSVQQNEPNYRSIEKKLRRAEFLCETTRMLCSSTPLSVTLVKALEMSKDVLGEIAFLMLIDENGELRVEKAASQISAELLQSRISIINARQRGFHRQLQKLMEDGKSVFISICTP